VAPFLALSIALVPAAGHAASKKSKAQKLYKKAVQAAKIGEYDEAIRFFEEARARGAPPVTLFNIGKCYEAMGEFYVAVDYYREYLTYPKAKKKAKIEKRIEELRIKPSVVTFDSIPVGAEVHEEHDDGTTKKLGMTPLELTVEAGDKTYYLIKKGFKTKRVRLDAGFGKPFPLEITLTPEVEAAQIELEKALEARQKKKKEYHPVGLYLEIGAGAALYPYTYVEYESGTGTESLGFSAGADTSFGLGWRFAHGVSTGFALGLRGNFRTMTLRLTGDGLSYTSLVAEVLAVPAFQVRLHEILGLELTLPLGIAWLVPGGGSNEDFRVDLVDGYIDGSNLMLLDVGFGAGLRFALARGLYLDLEPARIHLLVPLRSWQNDVKLLVDVDVGVRLGYEF
jgi:hypothetical protein